MEYTSSQSLHSSLEDYICVSKERLSDTNTKDTVVSHNTSNFHSHEQHLTKFAQHFSVILY